MSINFQVQTRNDIYHLILENPGIYPSEAARLLKISTQLADYHILYLERNNLITVERQKGYKACFVKDLISSEDKNILSIISRRNPLRIVLYLLENPGSKNKDICRDLDIKTPNLSYHLRVLLENGIITRSDVKKMYSVSNKKKITNLLLKFKPDLLKNTNI